jgi:DNA-binding response OmpR family regulator
MRILLVADTAWVVEDVEAALAEARYEITTLADPTRVAEAAADADADMVIADLQVASMGGMAVIRRVRAAVQAGRLDPTPTLMLLDREADAFIAGRAGADAWVRKPFGSFELRELVDRIATVSEPDPA